MRFHVENMACGHCGRTIRKAIAAFARGRGERRDVPWRHVRWRCDGGIDVPDLKVHHDAMHPRMQIM